MVDPGDTELDALNCCVKALKDSGIVNYQRWRVLDYLLARFSHPSTQDEQLITTGYLICGSTDGVTSPCLRLPGHPDSNGFGGHDDDPSFLEDPR